MEPSKETEEKLDIENSNENLNDDFVALEYPENVEEDESSRVVNNNLRNYNTYTNQNFTNAKNTKVDNGLSSKIGKANSFLNGVNNIKEVMGSKRDPIGLPKKDGLDTRNVKGKKSINNVLTERVKDIATNKIKKEINKVKIKILIKYVLPVVAVIVGAFFAILIIVLGVRHITSYATSFVSFLSEKFAKEDSGYTHEDAFSNDLYDLLDEDKIKKEFGEDIEPRDLTNQQIFAYFMKYNPCDENIIQTILDFLKPGLNSTCEVQKKLRKKVEDKEAQLKSNNTNVDLSYGLLVGTLVQGYNYEREFETTLDENGETIYEGKDNENNPVDIYGETAFPSQIIIDLMNDSNDRLKMEDIDTILDNMIFHESYTIYKYEVEEVDIIQNGVVSGVTYYHKCSGKKIEDTYLDYQKYLIFLRYGENKAKGYEKYYNLNKSFEFSDEQCKLTRDFEDKEEVTSIPVLAGDLGYDENNLNRTRNWTIKQIYMNSFKNANNSFEVCGNRMIDYVDTSDLYEVADINSNKYDNLTNSYSEGFMAEKFGTINEEAQDESDRYFVKNLEKYIRDIIDYAIDMDEIMFGEDSYAKEGTYKINKDTRFMSSYFDSKGGIKPCYDFEDGDIPENHEISSGTCVDIDSIVVTTCRTTTMSTPGLGPFDNTFNTYKGGAVKWKTFNGIDVWKARQSITLKDYVFGVTYSEIGGAIYNIEAIKAFMVMLMSYAFSPEQEGYWTSKEADGFYLPGDQYCFQVYKDYTKYMDSSSINILETAYEEAKNYMLFYKNSDKIFKANYVSVQQNKLNELANSNPNLTFKDLLVHPDFIASAHTNETKEVCKCNGYNYEDYEVKACKGSTAEIDDLIYYNQQDEPWGSMNVCNDPGWPFRNEGCFVTSIAMAAANLLGDSSITPNVANNKVCSGTVPTYALAHNLGVNASPGDISQAKSTLQKGGMVIMQVKPGTFTSVSHYILVAKSDGNKLYILDPYDSGNNGWSSNCSSCSIKGTEYTWDSVKGLASGYTLVTR